MRAMPPLANGQSCLTSPIMLALAAAHEAGLWCSDVCFRRSNLLRMDCCKSGSGELPDGVPLFAMLPPLEGFYV